MLSSVSRKKSDLILKAQKHHETQVTGLKKLLSYLRRVLPADSNKITGRNYQFTLSRKKELTVEIKSDPEFWSADERNKLLHTRRSHNH
jgi:hypothetical protein